MIKKIFRKIFSGPANPDQNRVSSANNFSDRIKVGTNSDIRKANLVIRPPEESGITIGNDCIIESTFVVECRGGKISVGDRTFIGGKGLFVCANEISIGSDVMFSWGCTLIDNDAHSLNWKDRVDDVKDWKKGSDEGHLGKYKNWDKVSKGKIIIKDKAWIGFNVIILKNVTIGEGAVVAAGSVVTKNVEPYTLVGGNPANFIRNLDEK